MTETRGDSKGNTPPRAPGVRALLDLLGLSTRAGALVSGTQAVRAAVREGKIHQVILAGDAAEGQQRKLIPLLEARRIPYYIGLTQMELGAATGRAPVSAIGLSSQSFATQARALLEALADGED